MNSDGMAARIGNLLGSPSSDAAGIPSRPPPPIPNHEIIARIGSGSYGEVWLARSVTGALRAVKVVWRCHFSSDRPYEREFRGIVQFEPISRSHPGVVNVLHVGRDDAAGCFFYVMELADDANVERGMPSAESRAPASGHACVANSESRIPNSYQPRTLASELKSRSRLPVSDVVSLGVQLAGALGHLHRHGLVHRDVKPSNVIFVNGQPKLADIGLVTSMKEDQSFVGTEGFIPPEGPGSERADLFALGRLLYEAVTGKNRCDFPGLPDDLDRWPKNEREGLIELNEVLARVCAPEAKKRHSNAAELAGDLNLILAGRSVRRAYRVERQLRRATWISVVALVLVFATVLSNWLQRRQRELSDAHARREAALREETQKSLARAETAERETEQQLYTALLEQGRATVLSGEMGLRFRALDAVRRAAAISNSAELRGVAIAALALPDVRFERELPLSPNVTVARLDPAFERIALGAGNGPVEIRSVSDHRLLATLPASTNRPISSFGLWSRDGRFFAVSRDYQRGRGAEVEVWEVASAKRVLLVHASSQDPFSFHPRLPRIVVGRAPAVAVTWNLEASQEIRRQQLEGRPRLLKFAPEGESFAAVHDIGQPSQVTIHSDKDGAPGATHLFTNRVHEITWHPSGRWIAVGDDKGRVHVMDAQTGETHLLGRHKGDATVLEFSPDGKYLFSGGWDREVICWDAKAMRRAFTVALGHHVQFRADGRQCAIRRAESDTRVQLYSFERPALHHEFAEDLGGPRGSAAFSRDGRWLAACGDERLVVWDLTVESPGAVMKGIPDTRVGFAPNGELFVNPRGGCSRWSVAPGVNASAPPELKRLDMPKPPGMFSFCLLSNGVVFTGTNGSRLAAFDQHSNTPTLRRSNEFVWAPTSSGLNGASPDEQWLAMFRPFDSHLYIHRLPSLERVARLTAQFRISRFEFSPLGDEVAVGNQKGVEFWSTKTWQRTRHLTNFTDILYSPDARTFWLWTAYRTGGLYDARTAEPLLPLPPDTHPLALSPDGRHLAVRVDARRVQLWDLMEVRQRLRELGLDWDVNQ